jgi:hypothetical protein
MTLSKPNLQDLGQLPNAGIETGQFYQEIRQKSKRLTLVVKYSTVAGG